MSRTGLNWQTAAIVLSLGTTVVFLPFYRQFNFPISVLLALGIGTALINGVGQIFFQKMIALARNSADPVGSLATMYIVVIITQIIVVTTIKITTGQEPFTWRQGLGYSMGVASVLLLTIKQKS
jgi:hypothetical protein